MIDRLRTASLERYTNNTAQPDTFGYSLKNSASVAVDVHNLGIEWLRSEDDLGDLATDPETFPYVKDIVDLWKRNDWAKGDYHYGMFKPIAPLWDQLSSVERVGYLAGAFNRRELLTQRMEQVYGSTDVSLTLGQLAPLSISLDKKISLGGNRFNLFDGRQYQEGRAKLGMVDIDYSNGILLVNLVQDYPGLITNEGEDERLNQSITDSHGDKRNLRTLISTRQRRIRDVMKRERVIQRDPYAAESAGVEELLIYSTLEILASSGVISPTASVLIPKPEATHWAGFDSKDAVDEDCKNGTGIELRHALARAMERLPEALKKRLRRFQNLDKGKDTYSIASEAFAHSYWNMNDHGEPQSRIRHEGVLKPLPQLLGELLLSQVIDSLRPTEEELERLGFYDLQDLCTEEDREQYHNLMYTLAMRTPDYLRVFHPYRTAFSDTNSEDLNFGRAIKREDLFQLSFAKEIKIEAKAA